MAAGSDALTRARRSGGRRAPRRARLWRGPALADFAYEPFAQAEIARLEELRLDRVERRIEADLALGRHAELVGELEGLVASTRFASGPARTLMLALYRSGRQAEALDAYQEARRTLVEELGIDPVRALQELERAILRQDPSLDSPARRPQRAGPASRLRPAGRSSSSGEQTAIDALSLELAEPLVTRPPPN